ncbi:MAG: hypothetical protein ACPG5B_17580 [Chitinophagales bacterium]
MAEIIKYILDNKDWIFSGIGLLGIGLFFKDKLVTSVSNIALGKGNNQAGRDINIYHKEEKKKKKKEK